MFIALKTTANIFQAMLQFQLAHHCSKFTCFVCVCARTAAPLATEPAGLPGAVHGGEVSGVPTGGQDSRAGDQAGVREDADQTAGGEKEQPMLLGTEGQGAGSGRRRWVEVVVGRGGDGGGRGRESCPLGRVCCLAPAEKTGSTWEFESFELKLASGPKNKILLFLFVWFVGRGFAFERRHVEKVKRTRQLPALAWIYGRVELFHFLNTLVANHKGLMRLSVKRNFFRKASSDRDSRTHGANFFFFFFISNNLERQLTTAVGRASHLSHRVTFIKCHVGLSMPEG